MFLETSAKMGENVEESFLKCSKTILAKIETGICFGSNNINLICFHFVLETYFKPEYYR